MKRSRWSSIRLPDPGADTVIGVDTDLDSQFQRGRRWGTRVEMGAGRGGWEVGGCTLARRRGMLQELGVSNDNRSVLN